VRAEQVERKFTLSLSGAKLDVKAGEIFARIEELRIGAWSGAKSRRPAP